MRRSLLPAVLLLAAACTPARAPVDWQSVRREGRVADEARLDALMRQNDYRFGDGEVALSFERTMTPLIDAPQLMAHSRNSTGQTTTLIVDTGSAGTLIGARSPLAEDVYVSKQAFKSTGYVIGGYLGYLERLRIGALEGPALAVGVAERVHERYAPSNILGVIALYHTQLEHRYGRWTLRSGRNRLPVTEPGWIRVPLERGTQVVRLTGPDGKQVYGMIDTGATDCCVVPPTPKGYYRLSAEDGRLALRVPADDSADWKSFRMAGYDISVVIGMDVLASREWRLTLDEGVWAIAPGPQR